MTITKFAHNNEESKMTHNEKSKPSSTKSLHIKRKKPSFAPIKTIYSFESFDTFCDFCSFLDKNGYRNKISEFTKKSDLYEYNGNYYLIFTNINLKSEVLKFFCPAITEFAHYVNNAELFERKIVEYGNVIMKDNAFDICFKYFV